MFKGMVTTLLSESLVQVMIGAGKPSAVQSSVTISVSFTVMFPGMLMLGGAGGYSYTTPQACNAFILIVFK